MSAMVGYRSALALSVALVSFACGGLPPRVVTPTRPLEERRAVQVINEAFRDQHERPVQGRDLALSETQSLHVDVNAQSHKYGVAYVTSQERSLLGAMLPPRDPAMGDALRLVSGLGADDNARVLVLEDSDYVFDEHAGGGRDAGSVPAELKLKRDVRDFLVRAHAEKWP